MGQVPRTFGARRVLIVDDNVGLAENIAEILGFDGHSTVVAASAEEALAIAQANDPEVLVTDYRLPGINGTDLVKQFWKMRTPLCAVVISAYTDERTMAEAKDAGARFVAKPVDFGLLSQLVGAGAA
jgi:two-component system response regulator AtoC